MTRRSVRRLVLTLGVALGLMAAAPAALAAEPTRLTLEAPPRVSVGDVITVRVLLVRATGAPVARAAIELVAPLRFLSGSGDVVLASARTGTDGRASVAFEVHTGGALALRAVFRGDERHAPAEAAAAITVEDPGAQLYAQHAGVHIPGLNEPPTLGPTMLGVPEDTVLARVRDLWPSMSGWPIAGALIVVWSLYAFVVRMLFRVAAEAGPQ